MQIYDKLLISLNREQFSRYIAIHKKHQIIISQVSLILKFEAKLSTKPLTINQTEIKPLHKQLAVGTISHGEFLMHLDFYLIFIERVLSLIYVKNARIV